MDISFSHDSAATAEQIFAELSDLASYTEWMPVVRKVELDPSAAEGATWQVTLTGSVGKLRRSKRIRMTRTELVAHTLVVFERREVDPRTHSAWQLRLEISETPGSPSRGSVRVQMHYGGRLWEPLVERMLRGEVEASKQRLEQRLTVSG